MVTISIFQHKIILSPQNNYKIEERSGCDAVWQIPNPNPFTLILILIPYPNTNPNPNPNLTNRKINPATIFYMVMLGSFIKSK